ncbi:MAG TPA: LysR family transcriptional regulator [Kofleriaceae bacterium]|nr:LysR family transcriptional regulator [Kofleriaceae bacterium]
MLHEIDLSRIDLNLLVLFDVVMAERHVGRAGGRLHLSPSAISHGLGRLRRVLHDPLFLKHPKGVVPTDRATELAAPIADILQRVRGVISTAEGFDPARSTRRFTIGAPDAASIAVLPALFAALARTAPQVAVGVRTIMPQTALADLDARRADVVIQPLVDLPPRFVATRLYDEEFAIALRAGHPLGVRPTLAQYCAASHVVVSLTDDPFGMVDRELRKLGRTRRVAATVPGFLLALALVAESDLLAAVPRQAAAHARRLGIVLADPPAPLAPLARSPISAIANRAALADAGVAWLLGAIVAAAPAVRRRPARRTSSR